MPPRRDASRFEGERHRRRSPRHEIVAAGIAPVPEGRRIFARPHGARESPHGRLHAQRRAASRGPRARLRAVPAPEGAAADRRARCPAASSRCSPSAARSWRARSCCCSTSRRWASRRMLVDADLRDHRARSTRQGMAMLLVEQNASWRSRSPPRLRAGDRQRWPLTDNSDIAAQRTRDVQAAYLGRRDRHRRSSPRRRRQGLLAARRSGWPSAMRPPASCPARKGYGEKLGLGTGLLLSVIGLIIWIFVPGRGPSRPGASKQARKAAGGRRGRTWPTTAS